MDPFIFITLVTLAAGMGGTGLGGLVGALFKSESNRTVSLLLAFAGGIMLSIVCFDLLAESVEAAALISEHAVLIVMAAVVLGVGVVYGLNFVIDRRDQTRSAARGARRPSEDARRPGRARFTQTIWPNIGAIGIPARRWWWRAS